MGENAEINIASPLASLASRMLLESVRSRQLHPIIVQLEIERTAGEPPGQPLFPQKYAARPSKMMVMGVKRGKKGGHMT